MSERDTPGASTPSTPSTPSEPVASGERSRHEVAEYTLLGLLRTGPCHGYRLAAAFAPEGWLSPILRLKMSQMYAYLHKLERQGWVRAQEEAGMPHPRRTFTLTPAGERAFDRWVAEPVAATRDVRLDFMVKLAFAVERDRAQAAALVEGQRAAIAARLERLHAQAGADHDASGLGVRGLVLGHRIRQSEAVLGWLAELRDQLRG